MSGHRACLSGNIGMRLAAGVVCAALLLAPPAVAGDSKGSPAGQKTPAAGASASAASSASATAAAAASAAPASNKPSQPTAKSLYDEGVDLFAREKFEEAQAKFLAAWELQRTYDVAANLGELAFHFKKPAEAAYYFDYALSSYPASGKKDKREWIEGRLKEARAQVVSVTVTVNVTGADVRIDGRSVGKSPLEGEVFVEPGEHSLEVTAVEHDPYAQKLRGEAGSSKKVAVALERPKKTLVPGIAAGAVGVATLVAGVALYVVSTGKYDESKRLHDEITGSSTGPNDCRAGNAHPKCADLKSAAELSDALYGPGVALMIGGGVLAAAGGAYLGWALRSSPPKTDGSPAVTAVGVRGTGLFLQGSF